MSTLRELLQDLGLNPKTIQGGDKVAFWCPKCDDQRKLNKRTAQGHNDQIGTWWCFRCMPRGDYHSARWLAKWGDVNYQSGPADPKPKKAAKARRNVPLAWSEAYRDRDPTLSTAWALGRGWRFDVCQHLGHHPDVMVAAHMPAGRSGAWLARQCQPIDRRLLIALRDEFGNVRNVSRRMAIGDEEGDQPKSLFLRSADTGGGWICFGRMQVIDKSSKVILVEGGPDYLLASRIWPNHIVIGSTNATAMPECAERIAKKRPAEVTIIPHVGDTPRPGESVGIGEACGREAAEILAKVSNVRLAQLGRVGDLSDLFGPTPDEARQLTRAAYTHRRPVLLSDAQASLLEELRDARRAADRDGEVQTIQIAAGAGKTHAAIDLAAEVALEEFAVDRTNKAGDNFEGRERGRVFFLAPNHDLAEEIMIAFVARYPEIPVQHIKGLPQGCQVWNEEAAKYYRLGGKRGGRRALCGAITSRGDSRCHLWDTCSARKTKRLRAGVNFSVHGMSHLATEAHLTIVDEQPEPVRLDVVSRDDVASLYRAAPFGIGRRWMEVEGNLHQSDLMDIWSACEAWTVRYRAEAHGQRAALFDLIDRDLIKNLDGSRPPPFPPPDVLRKGLKVGANMPSVKAWELLLGALDPTATAEVSCLRGEWSLEVRRSNPLPEGNVILLDATAEYTTESLGSVTGRHIRRRAIPVMGAAPLRSIWLDSGQFTAGSALYSTAVERVRRLLGWLRTVTQLGEIGIITHRRLAAIGEEIDDSIRWAYYGRDDRGTNKFASVKNWVCLGDPTPNLGAIQAECRLSGLSWETEAKQKTFAIAVQAIARARHIRRDDEPPILIYVGRTPPAVMEWERTKLPKGRRSDIRGMIERVADTVGCIPSRHWFQSEAGNGWLGPLYGVDLTTVSQSTLDRNIGRVAGTRRWPPTYVGDDRIRGQVHGPVEAIQAWADRGFAVISPE